MSARRSYASRRSRAISVDFACERSSSARRAAAPPSTSARSSARRASPSSPASRDPLGEIRRKRELGAGVVQLLDLREAVVVGRRALLADAGRPRDRLEPREGDAVAGFFGGGDAIGEGAGVGGAIGGRVERPHRA